MEKNLRIANQVLAAIGGRDNIISVNNCMTRLRFNLKDRSIPNDEEIKNIDGVLGVTQAGGQYQIIIGQNVPKVYEHLCEIAGFEKQSTINEKLDPIDEPLTLKNFGGRIMNYLSGAMTPLIPAMVAVAMFKTLAVLLGPDFLKIVSGDSDFITFCNLMYDSFFYFLPIFVGYTASRRLDLNPALGILMGAILLVPGFVQLANDGGSLSIFGLNIKAINYSNSLLPILLTLPILALVYKYMSKIIPDVVSTIFTPFLSFLVVVPISLKFISPLASYGGEIFNNLLTSFGGVGGFLAVAVVAALWQFLVVTGMHVVVITMAIIPMLSGQPDSFVLVGGGIAQWATWGMAFGAFLKIKNKEEKALNLSYFISGAVGGVTEPAMFGLGFKYMKPLIALAIGAFVGGIYAGLTNVTVYLLGATNVLGLLGYFAGGTSNVVHSIIASLLAFTISAALTFLFGVSKQDLAH